MVKTAKLRLEGIPKSSVKDILEEILDIGSSPTPNTNDTGYSNEKHIESYFKKNQKLNNNQETKCQD